MTCSRALLLTLALLAACNTPVSICNDQRAAYNAAYARCDIGLALPEAWLTWAGGPCAGMPATCSDISQVSDPGRILDECIPALETIDCDALRANPFGPSSCSVSAYQFLVVEGDRCGG